MKTVILKEESQTIFLYFLNSLNAESDQSSELEWIHLVLLLHSCLFMAVIYKQPKSSVETRKRSNIKKVPEQEISRMKRKRLVWRNKCFYPQTGDAFVSKLWL